MLQPINTAAIVILGVFTVIWGAWVANPFWDVFTSAKLYSALYNFAPFTTFIPPEIFWGCLAIICGLVTCRGALKRTYRTLTVGSGVMVWHWAMIATFYFIGDWHNTGGITSLVLACYAAFIYLNIKVNFKGKRTF